MASSDEPQIGGQATDNSPMISSVVTKVIADARGAYLAGNLGALWDRMNEDQRRVFQRGLVRQALWYAERLLPPDTEHQVQRACLDAVQRWLEDGSAASAEGMLAAREQLYLGDPYNDYDIPPVPDMAAYHVVHTAVGAPWATMAIWNYPRYLAFLVAQN